MIAVGWICGGLIVFLAFTEPDLPPWIAGLLLAFDIFLFKQFSSLTTVVYSDSVIAYFGGGLIRRSIQIGRISSVMAVRNHWLMGWGIRLIAGGWMFNVAGLDAVELRLSSGGCFRMGTDKPGELEASIRRAMDAPSRR